LDHAPVGNLRFCHIATYRTKIIPGELRAITRAVLCVSDETAQPAEGGRLRRTARRTLRAFRTRRYCAEAEELWLAEPVEKRSAAACIPCPK